MRAFTGLLLVVAVCVPVSGEEATGDLQVTCWPGYRIYLDGAFAGVTTPEEDGRYLRDVAAGEHTVRVEKLGHEPQTMTVLVPAGGAVELKVEALEALEPASVAAPTESPAPVPSDETTTVDVPVAAAAAAGTAVALGERTVPDEVTPPTSTVPETAEATAAEASETRTASAVTAEATAATATAAVVQGVPEPQPAPDTVEPSAADIVVPRVVEVQDVMFAYRVRGAALDGDSTVAITRERGGPRTPVMAFLCHDPGECYGQTKATFPPGDYRFRVTFRAGKRDGFKHDAFLELETEAGRTYLLDVRFDALEASACTVAAHDATPP
jgi:hypothetical protein